MITDQIVIQGLSIVLLGDFNPKIFQPAWFAQENLIRAPEAEAADIKIINPEIVIFELEWLELQVTRDRCLFGTTQEAYYEVVRDLCLGTFKLLRHTPIQKMGINRNYHFRMNSVEEWHAFGHKVAPKELWISVLKTPGLASLTIQGMREDDLKGYIRVKVEPSKRAHPGIYIQVNDHYEVEEASTSIGCEKIINIIESLWNKSKEKAELIINNILNWK
ncbi:hypothetical protein [Desulfobacca acetoxidans]|uniref:TIGR04255 family protein n=1 Tax=Desulfobacca acetoxidans (strain ATCC 700848 / DSM 11109 / ASRB2) TaxID=880072 RepID=F2ND89_DESAR|nr:hypothetical protein [Desulfobacca acetoxidans]AEB09813.1 hypothetical protein Desac_1981 [Desulfobacca acetoxidans DSM 11109]